VDIELSAQLAADLKVKLEYVDSSFSALVADLTADRCDVAMFAIGVTEQRAEKLRFTQPYLRSDIYAITTKSNPVVRQWSDIDKPGVLVAVQAGTFMEPVMQQRLQHAQLVRVKLPATRERELVAGRVDVFMTDFPYSRRLLDNADWARLISPPSPFSVMPYAYAVKPGDAAWLTTLDAFVARIKKDGRLERAANNHGLGPIVVR
jgi:cyclohexadienyl dehydratase